MKTPLFFVSFGFFTTASTASHSFARSVKAKMPFLCRSTKKGRKKGNSDVPSEASLGIAALQKG